MNLEENLRTIQYISENSDHVKINATKLGDFAEQLKVDKTPHWLSVSPFDFRELSIEDQVNFILVLDSIGFCYWGEPKWTVDYKRGSFDGSVGMITALQRAIAEGIPILDAHYRANISEVDFKNILKANVEIPLLQQRYEITKSVAKILLAKYQGDFLKVLEASENDAIKFLNLFPTDFISFEDFSEYKGKKVYFYKRVQLLISDIAEIFKREGAGNITNTDKLFGCADYKIPQLMRKLGILEYSKELSERIDGKIELPHNGSEEVEIRSNQLWAVELIRQKVENRLPNVNRMQIVDNLWILSQEKSSDDKPYHRTRTTAY
jgi:hypothetical protein